MVIVVTKNCSNFSAKSMYLPNDWCLRGFMQTVICVLF